MKTKRIVAAILNFAVVFLAIAYIAFIFLDIYALHITIPQEGGENGENAGVAIGAAVVLALMIYFSFVPYAVVGVMCAVNGAIGFSKATKNEPLPKALLIVGIIFKIIVLVSNAFFLILLFDGKLIAWGVALLLATMGTVASVVFDFIASKKNVEAATENVALKEVGESIKDSEMD